MTEIWEPRWIQRNSRDLAAFILLIIFPLIHVTSTRILPLILLVSLIVLGFGAGLARARGGLNEPGSESCFPKALMVSLGAVVAFIGLSAFWSFEPLSALREAFMMAALPFGAIVLAYGLRRTIVAPAFLILLVGLAGASIVLLLDFSGATHFHDMFSASAEIYDLNRVTSWLAVALLVLCPAMLTGQVRPIYTVPVLVLASVAIMMGEGQAAQLALVVGVAVGLMMLVLPHLIVWLVFGSAAFLMVAFPYVAEPLLNLLFGLSGDFLEAAHADHRLVIWQGYASWVGDVPLWGFGANADAVMGARGGVVSSTLEAAGYDGRTTSPHNVLLEWYVNFGLIGSVLAAVAILCGGAVVARAEKARAMAFTMVFAAAFTASATATEFFQGWWIATIIYGFMLAALVGNSRLMPGFGPGEQKLVVGAASAA